MFAGKKVRLYSDNAERVTGMMEREIKKNGELEIEIQSGGGFVIK